MSTQVSLSIKLSRRGNNVLSSVQIIQILVNNGWNLTNNGKTLYLPLGDKDDFNWQEEFLTTIDFFDLVKRKEQSNEIIGVGLYWDGTEIGGTLLLHQDHNISFSVSINRKILFGNITDVNWYLERILPCLETDAMIIEHFSFSQI